MTALGVIPRAGVREEDDPSSGRASLTGGGGEPHRGPDDVGEVVRVREACTCAQAGEPVRGRVLIGADPRKHAR